MRSLQPFVPVESHTRQSVERVPIPVPEVGLRWGRPADFTYQAPAPERERERRKGMTIRRPPEYKRSVQVHNITPVWRKFDVMRVRNSSDPEGEHFVDVRVTREALIPIDTTTQTFVSLGTGYVEGARGEERVIHTFLHLKIPPPAFSDNVEKVDEGEEGEWPSYPTEWAPPGRIGGVMTWESHFSRGMEMDWSR